MALFFRRRDAGDKKGDTRRRSSGDERVREGKRERLCGKTVCVRPIFFLSSCVCDARHRRAQRREIEGMEKKEEEEEERNDNERGS